MAFPPYLPEMSRYDNVVKINCALDDMTGQAGIIRPTQSLSHVKPNSVSDFEAAVFFFFFFFLIHNLVPFGPWVCPTSHTISEVFCSG